MQTPCNLTRCFTRFVESQPIVDTDKIYSFPDFATSKRVLFVFELELTRHHTVLFVRRVIEMIARADTFIEQLTFIKGCYV